MPPTTFPAGTSALEIIRSLGVEVHIEWLPEPVLTERDLLLLRLTHALSWHLSDRYDWIDLHDSGLGE